MGGVRVLFAAYLAVVALGLVFFAVIGLVAW